MKFLNKFTLGKYIPAASFVHALDPRLKIIAVIVLICGVFASPSLVSFCAWGVLLVLISYFSCLNFSLVLSSARPVLWLVLFTSALHAFFTPQGQVVFEWGLVTVTREGLTTAAFMSMRLIFLVLFAGLLTLTTSPMELADGMESLLFYPAKLGFPAHEMAMMMTIALRFIPTLLDETDRILKAQLSRGAPLESGNIINRVKAFIPVLVPLFIIVFQRADDLAVAMESRCYSGGVGRTRLKALSWGLKETLCLLFIAGFTVGVKFLKFF